MKLRLAQLGRLILISAVVLMSFPATADCHDGDAILRRLRDERSPYLQLSADGSTIVYFDDNAVWVMDVENCEIELISQTSAGVNGNGASLRSAISADGNIVAFVSAASDLVPGDTLYTYDLFIRNRAAGTTTRLIAPNGQNELGFSLDEFELSANGRYLVFMASRPLVPGDSGSDYDVYRYDILTGTYAIVNALANGQKANGASMFGSISADGRYVAFVSNSTNLVIPDANGSIADVYVRDMILGSSTRVTNNGVQSTLDIWYDVTDTAISADGSTIAFITRAPGLMPNDTDMTRDLFVFKRATGAFRRLTNGTTNSYVYRASLSANGRYIAFDSNQPNVVNVDGPETDVYVYDWETGQTRRISVNTLGAQGDYASSQPSITHDGQIVAFQSDAWNLMSHAENSDRGKPYLSRWMSQPSRQIRLQFEFEGRPARPNLAWRMPVEVRFSFYELGRRWTTVSYGVTDNSGILTLTDIPPGSYDLWLKGMTTLSRRGAITVTADSWAQSFSGFDLLPAGDANNDNQVTLIDFSILASTFGKAAAQAGFDARADFDGNGVINVADFSLLASNYGQTGVN